MVFFIIFGTRGVTSTKDRGQFECPHCRHNSAYRLKKVRRFFTLYFIPIIPLDALGEYVECDSCQGTFNKEILDYDASTDQQQMQAMYMVGMKQIMIAMLLADGVIDDDEVKELQNIFEEIAGVEVTEKDLREEIEVVQQQGTGALEFADQLAGMLNASGKEAIITAAYRIANADGNFDPAEQALLSDISERLDVSEAHLRGIMSQLAE